jgi:hypothetical protein
MDLESEGIKKWGRGRENVPYAVWRMPFTHVYDIARCRCGQTTITERNVANY